MTTIHLPNPPCGFKARLWRAPIWFYRIGLGALFGQRFLLLNHISHKSGQPRQAVLEVVDFDSTHNIYYVVSGFGEKAQWFQNILHTPQVKIQIGSCKVSAHTERLSIEAGERILSDYARQHPTALRELSKLLNIPYDGSSESVSKMANGQIIQTSYNGMALRDGYTFEAIPLRWGKCHIRLRLPHSDIVCTISICYLHKVLPVVAFHVNAGNPA